MPSLIYFALAHVIATQDLVSCERTCIGRLGIDRWSEGEVEHSVTPIPFFPSPFVLDLGLETMSLESGFRIIPIDAIHPSLSNCLWALFD